MNSKQSIGLARAKRSARILLLASSAMAALAGMPTYAQADTGAKSAGGGLEEVVVTAQRRAERLQDVPAAVSYLSADTLKQSGIVSVTDLARAVPGMNVSRTGAFTQPTIRGVGSFITGPGLENNVAIYVDGFYLPTTVANAFDLVDIENIQVLKGPQGALYGRNATGGAILITTRDPIADPNLQLTATYANYNDRRFSLSGSVGVAEGVDLGLSAYYRKSDGYVKDIVSGAHTDPIENILVRPKVKVEVNNRLSFLLTLEYDNIQDPTGLALSAYRGNTIARAIDPTTIIATAPFQTSLNFPPRVSSRIYGAYLTTSYDVTNDINLKSLTSFRRETSEFATDLDGSYLPIFHIRPWEQTDQTMTEELIATKTGGDFEWIAGVYYYNDNADLRDFTGFGVNYFSPDQKANAISVYGTGTYHITDQLSATVGGRYNSERKHFIQRATLNGPAVVDVKATFNGFTPQASLSYKVSNDVTTYLSYSRGFKSGLFNTGAYDTQPVNPEKITSYEVGVKSHLGDIRFDTDAFYYEYKDLQTTAYDFASGGIQRVLNAGSATGMGIEFSMDYSPIDALDIKLGGTYLHARYSSFPNAQDYCPVVASGALPTAGSLTCPAGVPVGGNNAYNVNASHQPLTRAPDLTANLAVSYVVPLSYGDLTLVGSAYYASKTNFSPNGRLHQGAYTLVGLRGTWTSPDSRWSVAVFGDNVFDTKYVQGFFFQQLGDFAFYGPPATYGITVGLNLD